MISSLASMTIILLGAIPAHAQGGPALESTIRVEVDPGEAGQVRSFVTGYVENDGSYRICNVRLRVDAVDAAGRALEPTFGWVNGDVPARGRAWFKVMAPRNAATRRVSVVSFDLVSIESP